MKKKHYRDFFSKEHMYWFIKENRDNLKRYKFRKCYGLFELTIYILEYEKINEDIKDITLKSKWEEV